MIREFSFSYHQLEITPADIEELLGFDEGTAPDPFPALIAEGLKEAPKFTHAKGGFVIFDTIKMDSEKGTVAIGGQVFKPARIVTIQLKGATQAALFLCTAGNEITRQANKLTGEGDSISAYILDIIGSVIVDRVMGKVHEELRNTVLGLDVDVSDRFSPGYCDWNVGEQHKLFSLLPENFCGITLSDSSLMSPIKSASGIIGIGPGLKQMGYQCYWCNDTNCVYGKINRKKKRKKIV